MTYIEHGTLIVKLHNSAPNPHPSDLIEIITALTNAICFMDEDFISHSAVYPLCNLILDLLPHEDQLNLHVKPDSDKS